MSSVATERRRVIRIDYKTLVATIGVLVSLAVFLVVLDSIEARKDDAQKIARRDGALSQAQQAADEAAAQSRANGEQITALIAQMERQNALMAQQQGVVSALRNELAKRGVSTVIENGKVRVVPGPVAARNTALSAGSPGRSGAAPGKSEAPRATSTASPTGTTPTGAGPIPTLAPTTTTRPTLTAAPTVLPLPLPTLSLPLVGGILGNLTTTTKGTA